MPRRARRTAGYVPGGTVPRLGSMIVLLIVVGMLYVRAREPQTWRWLAALDADPPAEVVDVPAENEKDQPEPRAPADTIVPGATDQDAEEAAEAERLLSVVSDRDDLGKEEMPAYWRLMRWTLAQSFADMERRSLPKVAFSQLWEQPEKYRGKLLRVRMHIVRVLEHPATSNSAGVKTVYEAWGGTDDSGSYPFSLVFPDLPEGMKVGPKVQEEGVFVGYFLTNMRYTTAEDKPWAAPVLIGRMHALPRVTGNRGAQAGGNVVWLLLAVGVLVVAGIAAWRAVAARRRPPAPAREAADTGAFEAWSQSGPDLNSSPGPQESPVSQGNAPE